jgi:hypothetical protein
VGLGETLFSSESHSVDVAEQGDSSQEAALKQIGLVVKTGVDFIEISGHSFENPSIFQAAPVGIAMGKGLLPIDTTY